MATTQAVRFKLVFVEFTVTDAAHILVIFRQSFRHVWVLLQQLAVKLNADIVNQFVLLVEPLLFHLALVPIEMSQHFDNIVLVVEAQ